MLLLWVLCDVMCVLCDVRRCSTKIKQRHQWKHSPLRKNHWQTFGIVSLFSRRGYSQWFVMECLWWYHCSGGKIEHETNAISKKLNGCVHQTHLTSLQMLLQLCICNEKSFNVVLLLQVLCDVMCIMCDVRRCSTKIQVMVWLWESENYQSWLEEPSKIPVIIGGAQ